MHNNGSRRSGPPSSHRLRSVTRTTIEPPGPRPADIPEAPKSAARLAAEAAFSVPAQPLPPAEPPLVVVRKPRVPSTTVAGPVTQDAAPASSSGERESPRVFRIGKTLPSSEPTEPGEHALPELPPYPFEAPPRFPTPLRKRVAADKRPGPMLQVFRAPLRQPSEAAPEVQWSKDRGLAALAMKLASLEPIFDAIARSQAVRLIDASYGADWQRLSLAADAIREEIDELLHPRPAGGSARGHGG